MILTAPARVVLIFAALAACVFLPAYLPVEAQRQQDNRSLRMKEVKELPAKAKRYALVIGVDEYQDEQISRLSGATNDAKAVADALVRYAGFPSDQVILLASDQPQQRQPNRGNILQYLSNLTGMVPKDGLLLISFAGHGVDRAGRGYLCPSDARIGGNIALLESTAVPVDTVREWIRETGVKQVLIILDACRNNPSGRGGEENRLTDSFARRFNFDVRNKEVTAFATLYATDVGHVAYEYKEKMQGYFTWMLVEGLKGGAANEKGEVTLGGLVKYLQEQVPKRVRLDMGKEKSQKPYAIVGGYKADELVISIVTPMNSADTSANAGAGLGALPLREFGFDIVTVNSSGSETSRRKHWAQYRSEDIAGISLELVPIPGGIFLMSSTEYKVEAPQHQVTVGSFYMGKYEVTQAQWRAVARLPKVARDLNSDPSKFKGDNLPVEQVFWEDAVEFCARLSRATGRSYRLPTEAEWEYACRAGTTTPFAFGETITPQLVNYDGDYPYAQASKGTYRETTTPVGFMGVANAFGLYDMHGNAWEWCQDYWHDNYNGAPTDGRAWQTAGDTKYRVLRGGSWSLQAVICRSAARVMGTPDYSSLSFGFRVVAAARTP